MCEIKGRIWVQDLNLMIHLRLFIFENDLYLINKLATLDLAY